MALKLCSAQSACEEGEKMRALVSCDMCKDLFCEDYTDPQKDHWVTVLEDFSLFLPPSPTPSALETTFTSPRHHLPGVCWTLFSTTCQQATTYTISLSAYACLTVCSYFYPLYSLSELQGKVWDNLCKSREGNQVNLCPQDRLKAQGIFRRQTRGRRLRVCLGSPGYPQGFYTDCHSVILPHCPMLPKGIAW